MTFLQLPVSNRIINIERIAIISGKKEIDTLYNGERPWLGYEVIFFNHNAMGTKNIYIEEEEYLFIVSKLEILQ